MFFADDIILVGEDVFEVQNRLKKMAGQTGECRTKDYQNINRAFCGFGGTSGFSPIAIYGVFLPVCSDLR